MRFFEKCAKRGALVRTDFSLSGFIAKPNSLITLQGQKSAIVFFLSPSHKRAAELHLRESEAVTQAIGGLRQAFKFFATARVQQIKLLPAVRERRESHTDEAHFTRTIPMAIEQSPHIFEHDGVQVRGFAKSMRAREGFKPGIANRECHR